MVKTLKGSEAVNCSSSARHALLMEKLTKLKENELTQKTLIPLFRALGFDKVDYHGGPYEEGKDTICWRSDELGLLEVAVAQVKKFKPSPSASSKESFTEVVSQLQQCIEKEIPSTEGLSYKPSIVYFVTPYQIDTRALQSRFEGYSALKQRGVKIIDGPMLAKLLIDKLPKIVSELIGNEVAINDILAVGLSNSDLLNALNISADKNISSYYSHLEFGVGRITSSLFFSLKFHPNIQNMHLSDPEWKNFSKIVKTAEDYFKTPIILPCPDDVESEHKKRNAKYLSKANSDRIKSAIVCVRSIRTNTDRLENVTTRLKEKLSIDITHSNMVKRRESNHRSEKGTVIAEEIVSLFSRIVMTSEESIVRERGNRNWDDLEIILRDTKQFVDKASKDTDDQIKKVSQILEEGLDTVRAIQRGCIKIKKLEKSIIEQADYECSLDAPRIASVLKEKQKWLRENISKIGKQENDPKTVNKFFSDCTQLFTIVDSLYSDKLIKNSIIERTDQIYCDSDTIVRSNFSMHQVFDAGVNVALYGEAGAGKTTTLQMYAKSKQSGLPSGQVVLFIPLTRLAEQKEEDWPSQEDKNRTKKLINYIYKYILSKGVQITEVEFTKLLNSYNRVVLILDGIDEVIKSMPRIIEAIEGINLEFKNCQIIVSSRISGNYLDKIKYLSLTLLPFTPEQQNNFIKGWFAGERSDQSVQLITHLDANPAVRDVLQSPLLATIFCVLAQHNIPLPNNEVAMYKERFNLLFGHYDVHKHSKRLATHHNVLDIISRKLAYYLHSNKIRQAKASVLKEWAVEMLESTYSSEQVVLAVDELIDPCNILVPMSESAEYGFGHLRFQEYLTACELQSNRGLDIYRYLKDSWWRGVLVLFSKMTDDIGHLVEGLVVNTAQLGTAVGTLEAMIEVRPHKERLWLREMVAGHKKLDIYDGVDMNSEDQEDVEDGQE